MTVRRARKGPNGKGRVAWALPEPEEKLPEGDFLPPGFQFESKPEKVDSSLSTYFLHTEKRGLARYLPAAVKQFQKGFRAVFVTKAPIVFDRRSARVAGRVVGDHFDAALPWAKRSIIDELQQRYVLSGGGTERERERVAKRFFRLLHQRDEWIAKLEQAEKELEESSIEMVLRYGAKPIVLDGRTLDACSAAGDKVFWRSRTGK